jgi:organic radical activating enzyme
MTVIKIYNDVQRFTIDWTLNTMCTYHCSYCPDTLHRGVNVLRSREEDPVIVKNFLTQLKSQLQGRSVQMFINGGEPTISPVLDTIIDFVHESGWSLYVNTNGSRSMEWWQEYAPKIYKVTISYHPESADDSIFDKVALIGSHTNVGVFTLMYPPEPYWTRSVTAFEKFRSIPDITLEPSRVFKRENVTTTAESYEYSQEQLAWLDHHTGLNIRGGSRAPAPGNAWGNSLATLSNGSHVDRFDEVDAVNRRENSYTGWACNMGVDSIFIKQTGEVDSATCGQAHSLGTIFDFKGLRSEPTICNRTWCMCTLDVLIPKEKINE